MGTESMKFLVLLACVGLALSAPFPQVVLPYGAVGGYPYGLPYGGAPIIAYNALDSGLVYPVAEDYVHDPSGDAADDAAPATPAYAHDAAGDVAEAYVHDVAGDA